MIDRESLQILGVATANGKTHDFMIYKRSRPPVPRDAEVLGDTAYQGLHQQRHGKSTIPCKKKRGDELSKDDKKHNRALASRRIVVEHVIGRLKRFKIIADRYRNRRRRFGLRFSLIAGIYNFELDAAQA